jgi:hypothetical protein
MSQDKLGGKRVDNLTRPLVTMGILWLLFAVALVFYQLLNPPAVEVEWDTATEVDAAGFYLYRSQARNGNFSLVNDKLIPSRGNAVSGATYTYVDRNVVPGQTYYYVLEEVEYDSSTNRYEEEMFAYTVPNNWWMIITSAVCLLVGFALLINGLKESTNA